MECHAFDGMKEMDILFTIPFNHSNYSCYKPRIMDNTFNSLWKEYISPIENVNNLMLLYGLSLIVCAAGFLP